VLKDAAPEELVEAVRRAAAGERHLAPRLEARMASELPTGAPDDDLSKRELDVLRLIARGHTNAKIAEQMYLSVRTVQVGFPMRFSWRLRSHLRSSCHVHTRLRARRGPTYAIANKRAF
jgi:FixJ family two-component response regulator